MMTIKILSLSWETTLLRYFLMMFVVITGVLTQTWALAFLGLPIFLSAILGISIERKMKAAAKLVPLPKETKMENKKVG